MKTLTFWLIDWPERVARHIDWLAPLFARIVVGWVFLWSGWGKLNNLAGTVSSPDCKEIPMIKFYYHPPVLVLMPAIAIALSRNARSLICPFSAFSQSLASL